MKDDLFGIVMSHDGVYFRQVKNLGTENMATMFINVTKALTDDYYFEGKWDRARDYPQGYSSEGINLCICNHDIENVFFIKHKETGIIAAVGCECVKKVDTKLHSKLTKELCDICEDEPIDKRKKEGKEGKCLRCYLFWSGRYKCKFPKYKDQPYRIVMRNDPKYCVYLVNKIEGLDQSIKKLIIKTLNLTQDLHTKIWS
jgi:hypothetical protein